LGAVDADATVSKSEYSMNQEIHSRAEGDVTDHTKEG
jgi:hypothetical protein